MNETQRLECASHCLAKYTPSPEARAQRRGSRVMAPPSIRLRSVSYWPLDVLDRPRRASIKMTRIYQCRAASLSGISCSMLAGRLFASSCVAVLVFRVGRTPRANPARLYVFQLIRLSADVRDVIDTDVSTLQ
jgi:hypothetical protein